MARISIVAAISENRALGKGNRLIFDIKEDMRYFRSLTFGHPVIMGRKTYESIGRPLPGRTNIVVTKKGISGKDGVFTAGSVEEALNKAFGYDDEEIFIIGGGQIYEMAMPYVQRLYLTVVKGSFQADTFFPDYSLFGKVVSEKESSEGDLKYKFLVLEK